METRFFFLENDNTLALSVHQRGFKWTGSLSRVIPAHAHVECSNIMIPLLVHEPLKDAKTVLMQTTVFMPSVSVG